MLEPNDLKTWTILIVDDEPDNLEVIAQSLDFFGATVKTAKDGLLGLKLLETYEANLILLDLSMPNMDGWQMRAKVKENPQTSQIPVIALTAHAMAGDRERALEAGFDGYLTKPVNVPTLVSDVKKVLVEYFAKAPKIETPALPIPVESIEPNGTEAKIADTILKDTDLAENKPDITETTETGAVTQPVIPVAQEPIENGTSTKIESPQPNLSVLNKG